LYEPNKNAHMGGAVKSLPFSGRIYPISPEDLYEPNKNAHMGEAVKSLPFSGRIYPISPEDLYEPNKKRLPNIWQTLTISSECHRCRQAIVQTNRLWTVAARCRLVLSDRLIKKVSMVTLLTSE
ncbi:MAG: hypothetical protein KDE19_15095, partial [Caldilineaceae bacterium]|nr:hypothetical protein [Caldilineaceae bacterium]